MQQAVSAMVAISQKAIMTQQPLFEEEPFAKSKMLNVVLLYTLLYSPLGMKYPHASSSITRDYGSFDGSCGTSLSSCAQTFLPRRLSHSVSHTLFIIFIDLERGG